MLEKYSPKFAKLITITPPCATGEGILMAEAAGAQLLNMEFQRTATDGVPIYLPANAAAGMPNSTLLGRPLIAMLRNL